MLVDLATISVVVSIAFGVSVWLDLFEHIILWMQRYEFLEIDELIAPAMLLPFAAVAFAVRRWLELRKALAARERAEARLADAARLEGVLLAARTMQHELNNQLGITVGYAEMLATDDGLSDEQRELASIALHGAERAVALLNRLRTVTQLDLQHLGAPDGPVLELAQPALPSPPA